MRRGPETRRAWPEDGPSARRRAPLAVTLATVAEDSVPVSLCVECRKPFDGNAEVCGPCVEKDHLMAYDEDFWRYEEACERRDRALYDGDYCPGWNHEALVREARKAEYANDPRCPFCFPEVAK